MPYTINKTDGTALVTLADGSINSDYSVTFVGKNYANYGAVFNENFLQTLENFSNGTAPSLPLEGQLWWDNVAKSLRIYYSGSWRPIPLSNQITGTTNQITISSIAGSSFNLSLPQNIHLEATPTFRSMNLTVTAGPPLTVSSNQLVSNFNADRLDNFEGTYYLDYENFTNKPSLGTISSQNFNNVTITGGTISSLSTPLPVQSGGTGGITAEAARINLGLTGLATAGLPLDVSNGGTGADNAAGARINLGLGSIATQSSISVNITGGTITGLTNLTVTSGTPTVPTAAVTTDSVQIATTAFVHDILPKGVILMWYGTVANIPDGWALCNGQTVSGVVTPDLRNRFIIGASLDVGGVANTDIEGTNKRDGGSKDAVIVTHNHGATTGFQSNDHTHTGTTASVGNHSHGYFRQNQTNFLNRGSGSSPNIYHIFESSTTDPAGAHDHTFTTEGVSQSHNHSVTVQSSGEDKTNKNLPPYYALCYIIKVTG